MNKELFKYYQAKSRDTGKTTAEALSITPSTLSSKLNCHGGEFSRAEIAILAKRWNLSSDAVMDIFFSC